MVMEKKGTVTELSSVFPAEEAQKASKRVQDAIAEREQQLNKLKGFVNDNVNLINLVQKLPDETHHNIMVPFGKAAFFPGRLIHTNEFMVLLGEGYYAERTCKQTIEILKRRGKSLDTQIESLKAIMQDLKAEASFFDATARESAEGLVEIMEDYVEEDSSGTSTAGYRKSDAIPPPEVDEDDEYARILARMDELEKEEEAEEEGEEDSQSNEDEQKEDEQDSSMEQISTDEEIISSPVETPEVSIVSKDMALEPPPEKNHVMDKALEPPPEKKDIRAPSPASNMTVIGSIVEHAHNIGGNLPEQQAGTRSSKPVSRFKMQRK